MGSESNVTDAERRILQAAATGEWIGLGKGNKQTDDPANAAHWSRYRTVHAEFLIELLTGRHAQRSGPLWAVRLSGARIVGSLDLAYASIKCPMLLHFCYFEDPVYLTRADAPLISLAGCHTPRIDASSLTTARDLVLTDVHCSQILLIGARIGGNVDLSGAILTGDDGVALVGDQMVAEQSLFCREGFSSHGEVRLHNARIGGQIDLDRAKLTNVGGRALGGSQLTIERGMSGRRLSVRGELLISSSRIGGNLDFDGAELVNPGKGALVAEQVKIVGNMSCGYGFSADGQVRLAGAEIGGQLDLSAATVTNPQGISLEASGLRVGQGMLCRDRFVAEGEVVVSGARIDQAFDLRGARLSNKGGMALQAESLTVGGGMYCEDGFSADGELRLLGAHIDGNLQFREARLTNPGGRALYAGRLTVGSQLLCYGGFQAEGEVHLDSASIGGWLNLEGARLANPTALALAADLITVKQSLNCGGGFSATGEVRLQGAQIGNQFNLGGATLNNTEGPALNAQGIIVDKDMFCRKGFSATGQVILTGARIGGVLDFTEARISGHDGIAIDLQIAKADTLILRPDECRNGAVNLHHARVSLLDDDNANWPTELVLNDFVYERIRNEEVRVGVRLAWLRRNQDGYAPQLYEQLATTYRKAGAEEEARRVAIAKHWSRRRQLNLVGKAWNWLLYVTVGYGYRTWLAALWLAALVGAGWWIFGHADMTQVGATGPTFNAVAYTVDVLLPIVDLGQQAAWLPNGPAQYWSWALIGAGWVLTTAVVAGLASVFKKV